MAAAIPLPDVEDPWMRELSLTSAQENDPNNMLVFEWISIVDRKIILEEKIELFLNLVGAYPPCLASLLC